MVGLSPNPTQITRHYLDIDELFNADQTPIFFEYIPESTIDGCGVCTIWVRSSGKDKVRLTCMLLGSSFGRKCTPFLVLKVPMAKAHEENWRLRHGFGRHVWREIQSFQEACDVQIYANLTGWWNAELSKIWLDYHFKNRAQPSRPAFLHWESFSAHWSDDVVAHVRSLKLHLIRVPPGHTGSCQPADISWNHPLKSRLRLQWIEWMKTQLSSRNVAKCLQGPTRSMAVDWLIHAWDDLSASSIANGFRRICPTGVDVDPDDDTGDCILDQIEQRKISDQVLSVTSDDDAVGQALTQTADE